MCAVIISLVLARLLVAHFQPVDTLGTQELRQLMHHNTKGLNV
jgi:hypothetical protein